MDSLTLCPFALLRFVFYPLLLAREASSKIFFGSSGIFVELQELRISKNMSPGISKVPGTFRAKKSLHCLHEDYLYEKQKWFFGNSREISD